MRLRAIAPCAVLAAIISACGGGDAVEPPRPTSIEIVSGQNQVGTAGASLAEAPTFRVKDQNGSPMGGVPFTVTVELGGGAVTGIVSQTSAGGVTSIGTWTLGTVVGENRLSISTAGVPPVTITATSQPGAPANFINSTAVSLTGTVGEEVTPVPGATLTDAHSNAIATATVAVSVTGGGTAAESLVSDAQGRVQLGSWTLGTVKGSKTLTLTAGAATITFTATANPGAPATLSLTSGAQQSTAAGSQLPADVVLRVADQYANGIEGQDVTFTITAGGGSLSGGEASSNLDGDVILPKWRLGKRAVPQSVRAALGTLGVTVEASVATSYRVDVRFFGPPMTAEQRAFFTNAAARVSAVITGDVPDVQATNFAVATLCGATGVAPLNEIVDDVIIYASIAEIDGPKKVLAQAGPCAYRSVSPYYPAIGIMRFDAADLSSMIAAGSFEDVVVHEMLHVVGIGTLWEDLDLLVNYNTANVAYTGSNARQGCVSADGSAVCGVTVPVENTGGAGTFNSHWRESIFATEVMTGYANSGPMPLSGITVGGLADLGYDVNGNGADSYQVPAPGFRATRLVSDSSEEWERRLPISPIFLTPRGLVLQRTELRP